VRRCALLLTRVCPRAHFSRSPVGEDKGNFYGGFIPDENLPYPWEAATQSLLLEELEKALSKLSEREAMVLGRTTSPAPANSGTFGTRPSWSRNPRAKGADRRSAHSPPNLCGSGTARQHPHLLGRGDLEGATLTRMDPLSGTSNRI
jgi:hypothetical protein